MYSALPTAAAGSNATEIYQYGGSISNCSPPISAQMANSYTTQTNPSMEYADSTSVELSSNEVSKGFSKKSINNCGSPRKHPSLRKNSSAHCNFMMSGAGDGSASHFSKSLHQPHLIAKTVNGVTVLAYPTPLFVNTSGGISQFARDHSIGDRDTVAMMSMTDIGMIQHQLSTNPVTPSSTSLTPAVTDIGSSNTSGELKV